MIEYDAFTTKYKKYLGSYSTLSNKFSELLSFDGLFNRGFIQKLLVFYQQK